MRISKSSHQMAHRSRRMLSGAFENIRGGVDPFKSSQCLSNSRAFSRSMKYRLFVYGTLKRGQGRSPLLDGQTFLGEAKTEPRYRLISCGAFPCLVEAAREDVEGAGVAVDGELWEVDDACLALLDQVEGVAGGLFERREVRMVAAEGVEAYFCKGSVEGMEDCGARW